MLLLDSGDLFFKKFSTPPPESEIKRLSEKVRLMLKRFELIGYHKDIELAQTISGIHIIIEAIPDLI